MILDMGLGFWRSARLALLLAVLEFPASSQVVISQIYGGGGNSGATLRNDFIELFNRGTSAVSVDGWSVQYSSSTGSSWQATNLSGTIQPGHYYLVQEAAGSIGSADLPAPDATGTINMSGTSGKVALANSATPLSGACPTGGSIQDFVGYGAAANCAQGSPTADLSNTTAAVRAGGGCSATGNNASDFAAAAPNPRNSASPATACGAAPLTITNASPLPGATLGLAYSVTFAASGGSGSGYTFLRTSGTFPPGLSLTGAVLSGTPNSTAGSPFNFTIQVTDSANATASKSFQLAVTAASCTVTATITAIQGRGDTSSMNGTTVTTSGIVTARTSDGFFLQMPPPGDNDAATSDGLFVFTSGAPAADVAAGNSVCVTGPVLEFAPSSDPASPTLTEISRPTSVTALSQNNALPPPVVLTTADTDPAGPTGQLEKYEGMRVQVNTLIAAAPTRGTVNETSATATSAGVFYGVLPGILRPFREPGIQLPDPLPAGAPCCVPRWDSNPEVIAVNTRGQPGAVLLDVTAGTNVNNLVGPLKYESRAYTIYTDAATNPSTNGNVSATPVPEAVAGEFTIGSFNMERFFDTVNDPSTSDVVLTPTAFANRLNKASLAIRNVMRTPDVIGVEEMENLTTLQTLAAKIDTDAVTAGAPAPKYQAFLVEGNDIGGIDVGFLVKSSVTVVDVTQIGKDATYTNPTTGNPATLHDRPPLVLRAVFQAGGSHPAPVTVIVNHPLSLTSIDDPVDGPRARAKRVAQAEFLANYMQSRQAADPTENIVSVGDYNSFQFNDGYVDFMGIVEGHPAPADQVVAYGSATVHPALTDLVDVALPADQKYSYSFNGAAQVLDHVVVNRNMLRRMTRFAYARNDADFPEVYRNDPNRPERISDHDMAVAYFRTDEPHPPVGRGRGR
jgi:predicted extracellular nuclease